MGILNAIFAPFIVLYLLMYSFFRYFEVAYGHDFASYPADACAWLLGVSQEPLQHWRQKIHPLRAVEIPRIQRTPTYIREKARRGLSDGEHVHRPISQ